MIASEPFARLGPATVIRGDARQLPLPDASVDLVVTSPPYFALRSYTDGGQHYDGQIGSEATPAEFVDALLAATREMVRVLKPAGSIWVNLGDKYSQFEGARKGHGRNLGRAQRESRGEPLAMPVSAPFLWGVKPKSLMGMPWRYAIACIDGLGLILRAEVIWSKPNGMPESVTDRVRRGHEQWFHFTKEPRYFAAIDEIREPHLASSNGATFGGTSGAGARVGSGERRYGRNTYDDVNPLGKLPGSVRDVPSAPLKTPADLGVDHFAAFPPAWPAWIIRGWSPTGYCVRCDEPREPVADVEHVFDGRTNSGRAKRQTATDAGRPRGFNGAGYPHATAIARITGYVCACPMPDAPTRPAVVLDPFGGTGTTAMAARALSRHGISVDLSADYCRLARWRCSDRDQLAAVRGLTRAGRDTAIQGQTSLFDPWKESA